MFKQNDSFRKNLYFILILAVSMISTCFCRSGWVSFDPGFGGCTDALIRLAGLIISCLLLSFLLFQAEKYAFDYSKTIYLVCIVLVMLLAGCSRSGVQDSNQIVPADSGHVFYSGEDVEESVYTVSSGEQNGKARFVASFESSDHLKNWLYAQSEAFL